MVRAFKKFEQFLNFFEVRQSQLHWLHDKRFSTMLFRRCQTQPQNAIYHLFERFAGLAHFLVQEYRHVVIQCKGGSHIMMLTSETS